MGDENAVQLSAQEARRLYGLLASQGEEPDAVLARLIEKLEDYLYRTMTIEEIEGLQGGDRLPGEGGRPPGDRPPR